MPKPGVDVAMAPPQVTVNQPKPTVSVQPSAAPQVDVKAAPAQVAVQNTAGTSASVNVQDSQGQPQIKYEREAPKVVVNQAPGQAKVKLEQMDQVSPANPQPASTALAPAVQPTPAIPAPAPAKVAAAPINLVALSALEKGANSFTEAQARARLEGAGLTNVTDLKKDDGGIWRGKAMRNGQSVMVGFDFKGNIAAQ